MANPMATAVGEGLGADPSANGTAGCVPATGLNPLPAHEAEELAARFKALADPSRLRILSIVASNSAAETCVCDLSEPLELRQPTVSHHLKVLVEAGLLSREKRGVWAYYSLVPGAMERLAETLTTHATEYSSEASPQR